MKRMREGERIMDRILVYTQSMPDLSLPSLFCLPPTSLSTHTLLHFSPSPSIPLQVYTAGSQLQQQASGRKWVELENMGIRPRYILLSPKSSPRTAPAPSTPKTSQNCPWPTLNNTSPAHMWAWRWACGASSCLCHWHTWQRHTISGNTVAFTTADLEIHYHINSIIIILGSLLGETVNPISKPSRADKGSLRWPCT